MKNAANALLFGATGFVGSCLLTELLDSDAYEKVTVVVRKDTGLSHPKLKTLIGNYHSLPSLKGQLIADDVFICLGTTKKNTPDQKQYYIVDHDYPVLAAKLAKENGAKSVFVVSAVGADTESKIFYSRTKGEMERDIIALGFEYTHIFRPSMIMGTRKENRTLERFIQKIWPAVNSLMVGNLNKYKGIEGKDIAKAMRNAAENESEKVKVYHWKEMTCLIDTQANG
jgi:uncharacterized protein YbjT (DUF2867 family)